MKRQQALEPANQAEFPVWVGVDTGGTFTDFAVLVDGRLITHKVLSTPEAPERAIQQAQETKQALTSR